MSNPKKVLLVADDSATLKEILSVVAAAHLTASVVRNPGQIGAVLAGHADAIAVIIALRSSAADGASALSGVFELLHNVRATRPRLRRIVIADSEDLSAVMEGLHGGAIDSVLYRPLKPAQLLAALSEATVLSAPPVQASNKTDKPPVRRAG